MSEIDQAPLGKVTAELMDALDSLELGENPRLGQVAVVVEVQDGTNESYILLRCSDPRPWVQGGLLRAAEHGVWHGYKEYDEGDDE